MELFYEIIQSLIMGIIQGVTEFLPVSSSGHLVIAKEIADEIAKYFLLNLEEPNNFFTILLHGATLIAVFIAFRKRIGDIILSLFRFITRKNTQEDKVNLRLFLLLCAATAATLCIALIIKTVDDSIIYNPKLVGCCFIVTGLILIASHFFKGDRDYTKFGFIRSVIIGISQGIGILPGISRSGITISTAIGAGMLREKAGEFSFLLSIPAILGAIVLDMKDATELFENTNIVSVIIGMAAAFLAGLLSIMFLLKLIKNGRLFVFSFYLIPLGVLTILFIG